MLVVTYVCTLAYKYQLSKVVYSRNSSLAERREGSCRPLCATCGLIKVVRVCVQFLNHRRRAWGGTRPECVSTHTHETTHRRTSFKVLCQLHVVHDNILVVHTAVGSVLYYNQQPYDIPSDFSASSSVLRTPDSAQCASFGVMNVSLKLCHVAPRLKFREIGGRDQRRDPEPKPVASIPHEKMPQVSSPAFLSHRTVVDVCVDSKREWFSNPLSHP